MKILVISEKSNAAARIAYMLSDGSQKKRSHDGVPVFHFERGDNEYRVVGLRGHIVKVDYPKELSNWSKVDIKDLVRAEPEKKVTAGKLIKVMKELVKDTQQIIIATDYDREGELIGLETVRLLEGDLSNLSRARFSALTKHEIESAFESLAEPDEKLAAAAESRQIIDLAWGAALTRIISLAAGTTGQNYLSVGRVQSPTLSLIVDRHQEIEEFVPEPYWLVGGTFERSKQFEGEHESNPFWEKEKADQAVRRAGEVDRGEVTGFNREEKTEYPPPPFNTTMMLMEANKLGMTASRAMRVAEDLYTDGFISYPRTDNTVYPRSLSLKVILEKLKESEFSSEAEELLSQERIRPSRGKTRTTDHPPIHPVAGATKKKLKGDRWKIYELVTRRFMATVAPSAKAEVVDCRVDANGEPFKARGYRLLERGWRRYYPYWKVRENRLPDMEEGDPVEIVSLDMQEKETQPPKRYSQGSLIQQMERLGLGTKSTRHDIIQKLYDRKYVEGNNLVPTASGIAVAKSLEKHATPITESEMTATLEGDMEKIAEGKAELEEVVKESQDMLLQVVETMQEHHKEIGEEIREALEEQGHVGKCPSCGGDLRIVRSRKGSFIGCSNYPECRVTYPLPRGAKLETTEERCEECGLPVLRVIRRGQPVTLQCIDPKCETNKERTTLGKCPSCGGDIRVIYSRNGKRFAGCGNYPDCDRTYPLYQRGKITTTGESCPGCGAPVVVVKSGKRTTRMCINPDCEDQVKGKGSDEE